MSDGFEWLDPFEERDAARLARARAERAYEDGRQEVTRKLSQAMREGLATKMDMAVTRIADGIVSHMMVEIGAELAFGYFSQYVAPKVQEAFRKAAQQTLGVVLKEDVGRVRFTFEKSSFEDMETALVEYRTIKPIVLAYRAVL